MPGYRTHTFVAACTGSALLMLMHWNKPVASMINIESISLILACTLGGLFPDIDTHSKGQKILYIILAAAIAATIITQSYILLSMLSVCAIIPPLLKHRGVTHTTPFIVVIPLLIPVLTNTQEIIPARTAVRLYLFFVGGALTHLLLDYMPKRRWFKRK